MSTIMPSLFISRTTCLPKSVRPLCNGSPVEESAQLSPSTTKKANCHHPPDMKPVYQPSRQNLKQTVGPEEGRKQHAELSARKPEFILQHGGSDGELPRSM